MESGQATHDPLTFSSQLIHIPVDEQPIEMIKDYFGDRIGFYFHYLAHYAEQLMFPALVGWVVFLVRTVNGQPENFLMPWFAGSVTLSYPVLPYPILLNNSCALNICCLTSLIGKIHVRLGHDIPGDMEEEAGHGGYEVGHSGLPEGRAGQTALRCRY